MDSLAVQTGDLLALDYPPLEYTTKYANDWIGVRYFGEKGRGIVALRDIPAGTVIERCPVLIIPEKDRSRTDKTIVFTYVYMWEHGTTEQDLYDGAGRAAIALGLSSLLNHAFAPNAQFVRQIDDLELELRSCQAISAGDEITIDYQMKLWFDPA
jgi:SET domain-containing protein